MTQRRRYWKDGRLPLEERFWTKVRKTETCWIWLGGVTGAGYGIIGEGGRGGKSLLAHHVPFILEGVMPAKGLGLQINHKCDNPLCVNPEHMFVGTQQENILDAIRKGHRTASPLEGKRILICKKGLHEMVEGNIKLDHRGDRMCLACYQERLHKRQERRQQTRETLIQQSKEARHE